MNNWNIFNGLNNTILSVLVAVFTGVGIEIWTNQNFSILIGIVIILCFLSAELLVKAILINDRFVRKCISTKEESKNKIESINKIKESVYELDEYSNLKSRFWRYTIFSFVLFFIV
jgi:hypothetical protein